MAYYVYVHYTYILLSSKSHIFYFGSTSDLKLRVKQHNNGESFATKPHLPWKLVWYAGFKTKQEAEDFELYLKSGAGKAFAYKRLVSVVLAKDIPKRLEKKYSEALAKDT